MPSTNSNKETMHKITVRKDEWATAIAFFENKPEEVKFKRKHKHKGDEGDEGDEGEKLPEHSFIKVNDKIYVMANKKAAGLSLDKNKLSTALDSSEMVSDHLGKGSYAIVKLVQSQNGENFAVKIEARGARGETDAELKVMELLDYFKGEVARKTECFFKGNNITQKLYTVTKLRKGEELFKRLYFDANATQRKDLPELTRLLIALKCCEAIKVLHEKRIIHGDIKPENFMIDGNGDQIAVDSVDYGFSLILQSNKNFLKLPAIRGTKGYLSPELYSNGFISLSSDVFALGMMLQNDLLLNKANSPFKELIKSMIAFLASNRPTIDVVVTTLTEFYAKMHTEYKNKLLQAKEMSNILSNWDSILKITTKYDSENRNFIPKVNTLFSFSKSKKTTLSDTRADQIKRLLSSIREIDPNSPEPELKKQLLAAFKLTGTIGAELNTGHNYLGSKLEQMLVTLKKDLRILRTLAPTLTELDINTAKKAGEKDFVDKKAEKKMSRK